MGADDYSRFVRGLQRAWQRERAGARIYRALAGREQNDARHAALVKLAETEEGHAEHWTAVVDSVRRPNA